MLLIRAEQARDVLPEILATAGATLTIANAYRNQVPHDAVASLTTLFSHPENHPDAITFTSASTATNLFNLLESVGLTLPPGVVLASIGPITSNTLHDLGYPPTIESLEPTISSLVEALKSCFVP